jgi:hypothetical protein
MLVHGLSPPRFAPWLHCAKRQVMFARGRAIKLADKSNHSPIRGAPAGPG